MGWTPHLSEGGHRIPSRRVAGPGRRHALKMVGNAVPRHPLCRSVGGILLRMRVKTSITLPEDLLRSIDRVAGGRLNRSRLIEQAVRELIEARSKAERDARDFEIINRNADWLNDEAADVLGYQAKI